MSIFLDSKYLNLISAQLRNFSKKKDDLWNFSCPICGDSKKDTRKARGFVFRSPDHNSLMFKCHNCGAAIPFGNLLKDVNPMLYEDYCNERFVTAGEGRSRKRRDTPSFSSPATQPRQVVRQAIIDAVVPHATKVSILEDDHICKQYIIQRKLPKEALERLYFVDKFAQFVSVSTNLYLDRKIPNDPRLIIPFFDREGVLTMFQGRSLDPNVDDKMRYLTVKLHPDKEKVFGLERVNMRKTVYVTEGPLDSLFLPNAVATADSSLDRVSPLFTDSVLVFDNEPRNKVLCETIERAIEAGRKVVLWEKTNRYKDVNDMIQKGGRTIENVMQEINKNTFSGLEAILEFGKWKRS